MEHVITPFLNAMQEVEAAATALDNHLTDVRATQARQDAALKQLTDLIHRTGDRWDAATRARLKTNNAKYAALHKTLDAQKTALLAAQQRYTAQKAAFDDLATAQQHLLASRAETEWRQQKREAALSRTVETMMQARCAAQSPAADAPQFAHPHDSHSYIALRIDRLLDLLLSLDRFLAIDSDFTTAEGRYRPVSFLEVGCGQGRIMYLLAHTRLVRCASIEGFDFNADLVALGRAALDLGECIFVGDAMAVDYGSHDVIYSYRPFSDVVQQAALEARIVDQMQPGAYLIAPTAHDLDLFAQLTRMGDGLDIWKKTG